jgi:hypothetical protein
VALVFATFAVSALPSALLGGLLFSTLRRWLPSPGARCLLVLAYGLGTPALAYGSAFYGHQAAAVFLFTTFALLLGPTTADATEQDAVAAAISPVSPGRVALAGCAWASPFCWNTRPF